MKNFIVFLFLLNWLPLAAPATIIGVAGGSLQVPPATLGPYTMSPFPQDPREMYATVEDAPGPFGNPLGFSLPMQLLQQRLGGAGPWPFLPYSGPVYDSDQPGSIPGDPVELTLPPDTRAFYLYVSSNFFSGRVIRVTADDGTFVRQGSFAGSPNYFGFYQNDPTGPAIRTLRISTELGGSAAYTFSGRFGMAIPEPATLTLLAVGALAARRRR